MTKSEEIEQEIIMMRACFGDQLVVLCGACGGPWHGADSPCPVKEDEE